MNVDDEIRKSFETIVHLKIQIEEAKRIEELLKKQINENEEILESQRSPYDKSALGYKKETTHVEAST
jgi:hypothetical protein